jgi:indoleamine 2,3-dioxygenase
MSYAAAYTLYNYRFSNPSLGTSSYTNLRLIRAFERGLNPASSEAGFVLTHIDMVAHSPALILGTTQLLSTIASSPDARPAAASALHLLLDAMSAIESSMEAMWTHSRPADYLSYRTFIFGITNQSMFPSGVVYAGHNDDRPMSFRGESGANDSIIPLLDALLEIPMPANPLTEILKDFRSYRPKPHREFLAYVREAARELGVREYCTRNGEEGCLEETAVLYLRLLDTVRSFRWRHWLFAREYIIRRSKHPTATGGSPIVTWLPNQLFAVMDLMASVYDGMGAKERAAAGKGIEEMMQAVTNQREKLDTEVKRWCQERGV